MQTVSHTIDQLELGKPSTFEGLSVFPLFGKTAQEADYLTLDEAMDLEQARVLEVSESGEVANLLFENLGNRKVLLVDGDELIGAKQNRIINLTILVAAHTKIEIPVSCVEAGRWSYRSDAFMAAKRSMYSRARAAKMQQVTTRLKRVGERYSDQSAVWDDIADCSMDLGVESETGAMSELFEQHEDHLEKYRQAFQVRDGQVGAVFAVHGTVQGIECFDHPRPFGQYLGKLVSSYAVEALRNREADEPKVAEDQVQAFLKEVSTSRGDAYAALGEGEDLRLSGEGLAGGALVVEGRVMHLAAFRIGRTGEYGNYRARHYRSGPVE